MKKALKTVLSLAIMFLIWSGCSHMGAVKAQTQGIDAVAAMEVTAPPEEGAPPEEAGAKASSEEAFKSPGLKEGQKEEALATAEEGVDEKELTLSATPDKGMPKGIGLPAGMSREGASMPMPPPGENVQSTGAAAQPAPPAPPASPGKAGKRLMRLKKRAPVGVDARRREALSRKAPAPKAPAPEAPAPEAPLSSVTLNFENADIYQVIKTISNLLGFNYMIDPAVKGTVNMHTRGRITKSDLYDIFNAILKINGASVVKEGEIHHIVPTKSVKTRLLIPRVDSDGLKPHPNDEVVLEILRLRHLSATEIAKVLKPFLSIDADITPFEANNILLVTDFARNVEKIIEIVKLIDVNIFEEVGLRIYPIHEADVQEIAQDMQKVFSALEVKTTSGRGPGINFIPVSRINSLLVVTSMPQAFEEVEKWLVELDRNISQDEVRTYIYHVKNGIAGELADILNAVFAGTKVKRTAGSKAVAATAAPVVAGKGAKVQRAAVAPALRPMTESITGEVRVIPYPTTNTIIIKATPRDYPSVEHVLEKLDIVPRQVLIEILIVEVTLSDELILGVEFADRGTEVSSGVWDRIVGTSLGLSSAGTLATGGLTASILKDSMVGTINALASKNQIDILASPHIIATDGKEASIDIGDEVPLIATRIFLDNREEITIERRDTGVILKVTPHINTTGLVTLDLSLELSSAAKAIVGGESDIRIFQRNAKTTMVVQDKQTIVIGGLIDKTTEQEVVKIPFLGDIPLLGVLFRKTKDSTKRTELVLLITPHVIHDLDDANDVTYNFIEKLKGLRKKLEENGVKLVGN